MVAQAQPAPPSFGKPQLPNISSQFSNTLSSKATMDIAMMGLVWFRLAL